MLPYKSIIRIDERLATPKYLQITNAFITNISLGVIAKGTKLPGSRNLADQLGVNRRTVIAAVDELMAQGWVQVLPSKGCMVVEDLPQLQPRDFSDIKQRENHDTGFEIPTISSQRTENRPIDVIDDGYPDVRIAPLKELGKNYSYIMRSHLGNSLMTYKQAFYGDLNLRKEIASHVSETRSIHVSEENILITRGSLMAFHLLFRTILNSGDSVAVGYPGFNEGYQSILEAKGRLEYIPVDENGFSTEHLEQICRKRAVRAVFIIPHHHYPTTVSLSASRRSHLLKLAEEFQFAIIEDDYDYDFHYSKSPLLPIASSDRKGFVAYVGSFSKTVAPSLRIGFVVAPSQLIDQLMLKSKYLDSFGNTAMERALAMMLESGEIKRHLKKALTVYKSRRDHFQDRLESDFKGVLDWNLPEGGLAFWLKLRDRYLVDVIEKAEAKGIRVSSEEAFSQEKEEYNAIRFGFASRKIEEMDKLLDRLSLIFK